MKAILIALTLAALGDPMVKTAGEPTTRVYVRTIPTGAQIKLDGQVRGKSDALLVVPPGVQRMTVDVELDGHYPQLQEVEIRGGRITRVELVMRKRPPEAARSKPETARKTSPPRSPARPAANVPLPSATPGNLPITPTEERVERALSEKGTFRYHEIPFSKVIDEFRADTGGVEIVLDQKALEEAGFDVDKPVIFAAADISRRSALDYILWQEGLTWTIRGDVVIVTTPDEDANDYFLTKVYPIGDLTPDREALRKAILETIEPTSWEDVGGAGSLNLLPSGFTAPSPHSNKNKTKGGAAKGKPPSSKAPVSAGAKAMPKKGSLKLEPRGQPSLVIFQIYRIHRQIMDLLTTLREVAAEHPTAGKGASGPPLPIYVNRSIGQETLRKGLAQPVSLDFSDRSFADIVSAIQKAHKIPILLDNKTLEEDGFDTSSPITFRMQGVPLRQALTLLLHRLGLVWTFRGDAVIVTTPDQAGNELLLAVYPIGDVVTAAGPSPLVQALQSTIAPTSWDTTGGPGAIAPLTVRGLPVLVIVQTRTIHDEIANLFEQLRRQTVSGSDRPPAARPAAASPSTSSALSKPASAPPSIVLSYVRDSAEKRRSFADAGHAVQFDRPQGAKSVVAVQLFCSRYGYPQPPHEDFHIYILDQNQRIIRDVPVPYAKVERGAMRWHTFEVPPTAVPERFLVAVYFNAHETKGVYLGMDDNIKESHSYAGLPESGFQKLDEKADWMVRVVLSRN